MVNKWVLEALQYVRSKLLQLVHWQVKSLHQLIELYFVDVLAQYWVLASIANNVHTAQVSDRTQYSVRTVEQCYLTLVVWLLVVGDENVQTSLVSREFFLHLLYSHILSLLDNPEVEALSLNYEVVLVANLLLNFLDGITWETWNDTVYESSAYVAVVGEPLLEAFVVSAHVTLPKLNVLIDALLQVVAIEEDQLTRHQNHTLSWVALEELVAMEQQLYQLTRIRSSRSISKLARIIECDTSLSCVRDDETHLWLLCQSHKGLVLRIWIECTANHVDTLKSIDGLTILLTLKVYMVEAVLTVQPVNHTASQRLNDNNRTVEVGLLVHIPYNPVNKCAKEVALTKLDNFLWHNALWSCTLVQRFKLFHDLFCCLYCF